MQQTPSHELAERSIAVSESNEFKELKRSFVRFIAPMSVAFLAWYLLYIILASYAPGLFHIQVFGLINIGLLFGLAQVVTTFAITMAYRRWADKKYDPLSESLREDMESGALMEEVREERNELGEEGGQA